ncbi:MAG: hypothetical protein ABIB43_04795 [archaeon]
MPKATLLRLIRDLDEEKLKSEIAQSESDVFLYALKVSSPGTNDTYALLYFPNQKDANIDIIETGNTIPFFAEQASNFYSVVGKMLQQKKPDISFEKSPLMADIYTRGDIEFSIDNLTKKEIKKMRKYLKRELGDSSNVSFFSVEYKKDNTDTNLLYE